MTVAPAEIQVVSREEVKAMMEKRARATFGMSASAVLKRMREGNSQGTLAESELSMLALMLKRAR